MLSARDKYHRRLKRSRARLAKVSGDRLRLSVFRSNMNIYAQIIDDGKRHTVVSASSLDKELRSELKNGSTKSAATKVGELIAKRAKKAGISKIVFDRGPYVYHGRVRSLAEAARENGLEF
tara:strand:+ start:2469 stop:2831 length:363 start_codon:yes stop_codon:yes gene_type:complete